MLALALLAGTAFGLGNTAAAGEDPAQKLTGQELRSLLTGTMVRGTTDGLNDIYVSFDPDGTMKGRVVALIFEQVDRGTWKVVGNKVCMTWSSWSDAEENCLIVESLGKNHYESYTDDGAMASRFKIDENQDEDLFRQIAGGDEEDGEAAGAVGAER